MYPAVYENFVESWQDFQIFMQLFCSNVYVAITLIDNRRFEHSNKDWPRCRDCSLKSEVSIFEI